MKRIITYLSQAIFIILLMSLSMAHSSDDDNPIIQDNRHYSYIYWENGYPTREAQSRRPQSWANTNARENPDLVIQTGYYSLVLDAKSMKIEGYDTLEGSDYVTALHEDVTEFTPASLTLKAYQNGVEYTATAGEVQNGADVHVRLIESGQFLQRYDHLGIIFTAQDGSVLDVPARLEISAWPEQVTFKLDFANFENTAVNIERTVIELTSPTGKNYLSDVDGIAALLSVRPHEDLESVSLDPSAIITEATDLQKSNALDVEFDSDLHALKVNLPIDSVRYPDHIDRVDEFLIEVTNPTQSPLDIPLVFEENVPRAITGTVMLLTDADDGKPSGIPVQISKNWHKNDDTGVKATHRGNWLRGSTYLTLPAGVTKRFKLKVVFGYWDKVAAASHAQLSLIGWGGNWKWDESALGTWGESMTYDLTQHLGSAFMADIRPAFTPSMSNGGDHNWTENVGGGDFLIYFDEDNRYRWGKRLKTAYIWTGPNMTQVKYSGVTDDDKIRFEYTSKLVSTNDYHRRFHNYRYEFLEDVTDPKRLVFYQMAADYYLGPDFETYYVGDSTGLLQESAAETGGNTYKTNKISFSDGWMAMNDLVALDKTVAKANRGIIQRSSTLNNNDYPVFMHQYGRSWGSDKMLFDLAGDSTEQPYQAGDVVSGAFEFIMPPKEPANYWGADAEFAARLATYTQPWEAVFDEYRYNSKLQATASIGTLINTFPLEIQADPNGPSVITELTIQAGGLGDIPVIIKDAMVGKALNIERYVDGQWITIGSEAAPSESYYQGYQNAEGKIDYTFSIPRPSTDLSESWQLRVSYEEPLPDLVPDSFSFESKVDTALNTELVSAPIILSGINRAISIAVSNGEYSIDDAAYTSDMGTISNGQTVTLRHNSSTTFSTTVTTSLTIGESSASFSSITRSADITPDSFNFPNSQEVAVGEAVISKAIEVGGLEIPVLIRISDGEYSINNAPFTDISGMIENGDEVRVRHTASANLETVTQTQLFIGSFRTGFTSTTADKAEDETENENSNGNDLEDSGPFSNQLSIGQDNHMETDAGLSVELGEASKAQNLLTGAISEAQFKAWHEAQSGSYLQDSTHTTELILDYKIYDLNATNSVATILLSLAEPLSAETKIRRYDINNGWQSFIEDANNVIESAISVDGNCPTDGSLNYQTGAQTGATCLRLSIQDGGPNDSDALTNGTIVNSLAISARLPATNTSATESNSGGGSMPLYWLVLFLVLGRFRSFRMCICH